MSSPQPYETEEYIYKHLTTAAERLGDDLEEFVCRSIEAFENVHRADSKLTDDEKLSLIKEIANWYD